MVLELDRINRKLAVLHATAKSLTNSLHHLLSGARRRMADAAFLTNARLQTRAARLLAALLAEANMGRFNQLGTMMQPDSTSCRGRPRCLPQTSLMGSLEPRIFLGRLSWRRR